MSEIDLELEQIKNAIAILQGKQKLKPQRLKKSNKLEKLISSLSSNEKENLLNYLDKEEE